MTEKKHRGGKTTLRQYLIYVEELKNNEAFRTNKFNPSDPDTIESSWEGLTRKLNASGGPQRTTTQWKKVFTDWKCNVRKKARTISKAKRETGGGPAEKPLTEVEELFLSVTGKVVIEGIDIEELGMCATNSNNGTLAEKSDQNENVLELDHFENNIAAPEVAVFENNIAASKVTVVKQKQSPQNTTQSTKKRKIEHTTSLTKRIHTQLRATENAQTTLEEINKNLEKLVELKTKEVELLQIKLQLKYNVEISE